MAALAGAPPAAVGQWTGQAGASLRGYGEAARPHATAVREVGLTLQASGAVALGGPHYLIVEPFARVDPSDEARSRVDLRDLAWEGVWTSWELVAGVRTVRWSVVESEARIDVVNQLDVADDGQPTPLGQPLVGTRLVSAVGLLEAYALPFVRERRFAGRGAALWSPLPVDEGGAELEHAAGRGHVGWAVRWSHIVGDFDLALAHFAGTSREPRYRAATAPGGAGPSLVPVYDVMDQTSLAAQWTRRAWLLKLEALRRVTRAERFVALVGGLEYAFADFLSVFAEYLHDGRGSGGVTSLEQDVFVGARLLTQDWTLSARTFVDRRHANTVWSATATRRLGDAVTAELHGRVFAGDPADEPPLARRLDSHVALGLSYFF